MSSLHGLHPPAWAPDGVGKSNCAWKEKGGSRKDKFEKDDGRVHLDGAFPSILACGSGGAPPAAVGERDAFFEFQDKDSLISSLSSLPPPQKKTHN